MTPPQRLAGPHSDPSTPGAGRPLVGSHRARPYPGHPPALGEGVRGGASLCLCFPGRPLEPQNPHMGPPAPQGTPRFPKAPSRNSCPIRGPPAAHATPPPGTACPTGDPQVPPNPPPLGTPCPTEDPPEPLVPPGPPKARSRSRSRLTRQARPPRQPRAPPVRRTVTIEAKRRAAPAG